MPEDYHGRDLDGPNCRKLLSQVDDFEQKLPAEHKIFAVALRAFDKFRKSCYGFDLAENYKELLVEFRLAYMDLKMPITPKLHVIFHHVVEFCERNGRGLGIFSEQCSESVHYDYEGTWKNYRRNPSAKDYGEQLKKSVIHYNSTHI